MTDEVLHGGNENGTEKIYETCQIFFFKDLVIDQRSRVSQMFPFK